MTLTIQRADLARTLAAAIKATASRNTIPVLANVLLAADGGRLTVVATDLDVEVASRAPAEGTLETTVDAHRLHDIVRRVSGDTVTLALADSKLTVKCGRSRFTLPTLPVADFPRLDGGKFDVTFNADFAALVPPVKFAISGEATRYYLNGVHLHNTEDGAVRAVATDGHRLAHNTLGDKAPIPAVIIPAKTVGIVPAGEITVSLSSRMCRFATSDTVIVSKLVDGLFPDYSRVIPRENNSVVMTDRKDLADAVARVATIAKERGRGTKFTIANDNIAIDLRTDDGTAHEDVPAQYSGEPIEIGFNAQYVVDVLAAVPGENINIALSDATMPAVFTGTGEVLSVLMPMRV